MRCQSSETVRTGIPVTQRNASLLFSDEEDKCHYVTLLPVEDKRKLFTGKLFHRHFLIIRKTI
jgi:hypothetical protein